MWAWHDAFVALAASALIVGVCGLFFSVMAAADEVVEWPRWRTVASLALAVVGAFFLAGLGGFA